MSCSGCPCHLDTVSDDTRHFKVEHVFTQCITRIFFDHLRIRSESACGYDHGFGCNLILFALIVSGFQSADLIAVF